MNKQPSPEEKAAAAWLLLAYSLNHSADCSCDRCGEARRALEKAAQAKAGSDAA
jgi:hypothetical protein